MHSCNSCLRDSLFWFIYISNIIVFSEQNKLTFMKILVFPEIFYILEFIYMFCDLCITIYKFKDRINTILSDDSFHRYNVPIIHAIFLSIGICKFIARFIILMKQLQLKWKSIVDH